MLPENIELRRAHAPLSEFVRHTYTTPLLFPPRSEFRYQSMGILLAAEIVERLSGMRLRDFEKQEIFDPLGMKDSSLGLGGRRISDLVSCAPAPGADPADDERFGPNSLYWRDMGCPWGGMHSTTRSRDPAANIPGWRRIRRQAGIQPRYGESDDVGPKCGA